MLRPPRAVLPALALATSLLAGGCGAGALPEEYPPQGVDGLTVPTPSPAPDDFVERVDNPWLPLVPGSTWTYESTDSSAGPTETVTVTVADETRVVAGVTATVVREVVTGPDGAVREEGEEWFAQDRAGNVWCLGEDTAEYDEEGRADRSGSWEAGVEGARAGLAMPARPRVGDAYVQESAPGEAEDLATVLSLEEDVVVDLGSFGDVLLVEETTPLEPLLVEHEYFARDVGLVLERTLSGDGGSLELVEHSPGRP